MKPFIFLQVCICCIGYGPFRFGPAQLAVIEECALKSYNKIFDNGVMVVGNTNCEGCTFRQLQGNPGSVPESMADAFGVLSAMEDEPTKAGDVAEALAALEAPACSVESCNVSIGGLLRYVTSAGAAAPRQELDEVVASGCAILDIPHQFDADFGSFFGKPDNPLA